MSVPLQILAAYAASAVGIWLLALCIAVARGDTVWAVLSNLGRDCVRVWQRMGASAAAAIMPTRQAQLPQRRTAQERALDSLATRFASQPDYDVERYERDVERVLRHLPKADA